MRRQGIVGKPVLVVITRAVSARSGNHDPLRTRTANYKKAAPNPAFAANSITRSREIVPLPPDYPDSSRATNLYNNTERKARRRSTTVSTSRDGVSLNLAIKQVQYRLGSTGNFGRNAPFSVNKYSHRSPIGA
jgi:hypothetical protein